MSKTGEFTAIIICESKATVSSGFPFSADYIVVTWFLAASQRSARQLHNKSL